MYNGPLKEGFSIFPSCCIISSLTPLSLIPHPRNVSFSYGIEDVLFLEGSELIFLIRMSMLMFLVSVSLLVLLYSGDVMIFLDGVFVGELTLIWSILMVECI